jgi:hypothetical protein
VRPPRSPNFFKSRDFIVISTNRGLSINHTHLYA